MSAYTRCGRSDHAKIKKSKGRERPIAVIPLESFILMPSNRVLPISCAARLRLERSDHITFLVILGAITVHLGSPAAIYVGKLIAIHRKAVCIKGKSYHLPFPLFFSFRPAKDYGLGLPINGF